MDLDDFQGSHGALDASGAHGDHDTYNVRIGIFDSLSFIFILIYNYYCLKIVSILIFSFKIDKQFLDQLMK